MCSTVRERTSTTALLDTVNNSLGVLQVGEKYKLRLQQLLAHMLPEGLPGIVPPRDAPSGSLPPGSTNTGDLLDAVDPVARKEAAATRAALWGESMSAWTFVADLPKEELPRGLHQ